MTLDYRIVLEDNTGRQLALSVNGDSIDALVRQGDDFEIARDAIENNSIENAVARNEIGVGCFIIGRG